MATHTHKLPPSSHTWPTSQIRAPFILKYIELLCDSPRQRAAIPLKAVVNHLWQRETAKDRDLHIHTSLGWTVERVEFLCLTHQWWINILPLPALPLVSLMHKSDTFSLREIHVLSLFFVFCPLSLFFLCTSLSLTHTHDISQGYSTSCCCKKSLFHLISSNRQTWAPRAGDWTEQKKKKNQVCILKKGKCYWHVMWLRQMSHFETFKTVITLYNVSSHLLLTCFTNVIL